MSYGVHVTRGFPTFETADCVSLTSHPFCHHFHFIQIHLTVLQILAWNIKLNMVFDILCVKRSSLLFIPLICT